MENLSELLACAVTELSVHYYANVGEKEGYFEKLSYGSETLDMTSEGLEEML